MAKVGPDPALMDFCKALNVGPVAEIRRIVIDIQAGHTPIVHVERFITDDMLRVVRKLEGVEITREDPSNG